MDIQCLEQHRNTPSRRQRVNQKPFQSLTQPQSLWTRLWLWTPNISLSIYFPAVWAVVGNFLYQEFSGFLYPNPSIFKDLSVQSHQLNLLTYLSLHKPTWGFTLWVQNYIHKEVWYSSWWHCKFCKQQQPKLWTLQTKVRKCNNFK